ncbi:MAG: hypothetical protein ABI851_06310 [Saprospiraceae bacterium]
MMLLLIIIFIFLLLIIYFLTAPFYFEVNTEIDEYQFRFHRLFILNVVREDSNFYLEFQTVSWIRRLNFLKMRVHEEDRKSYHFLKWRISLSQSKALLKSFRVKKCYINLDLDEPVWNALLFPYVYLLNVSSGLDLNINFLGENEIILQFENNLARMLWANFYTNK